MSKKEKEKSPVNKLSDLFINNLQNVDFNEIYLQPSQRVGLMALLWAKKLIKSGEQQARTNTILIKEVFEDIDKYLDNLTKAIGNELFKKKIQDKIKAIRPSYKELKKKYGIDEQ